MADTPPRITQNCGKLRRRTAAGPRLAAAFSLVAAVTLAAIFLGTATPSQAAGSSAKLLFRFKETRIVESSGLARATNFHRILYTHNDSGDSARFFAVNWTGHTRAVYRLRGATAHDWEDMANGPNSTLWLGDIGDNHSVRDYITVYRVKEPTKLVSRAIRWTGFNLCYPGGKAHNAEALLVRPRSGRVYVVTKQSSGAGVYRAPKQLSASHCNSLTRVADAPAIITAGDFAPDGSRLATSQRRTDVRLPAHRRKLTPSGRLADRRRVAHFQPRRLECFCRARGTPFARLSRSSPLTRPDLAPTPHTISLCRGVDSACRAPLIVKARLPKQHPAQASQQ